MKKFIGFALTSCLAVAALGQLNPTVQRLSRPSGPVPPDCDTASSVAAAPRLQVSEIPEPAAALPPVAPPSSSLRSLLRETRAAAEAGDREAFRDALAAAKQTLRSYPAGAEKRSAEEVVRVYNDLDRLWTYQYESPTGAFFDESSDAYRIVASYPGYADAIRRQTLTVGGRRLYPTTESRRFLAAEGARRLGGGKAAPPVVARAEPAPSGALKPVQPKRAPQKASSERKAASGEQRSASSGHKAASGEHKAASSEQRSASRRTASKPVHVASKPAPAPAPRTPAPAPARRKPAPAPAPAPATPIPAPAPAPVTPAATETTVTTASAAPPPAPVSAPPAPATTTTAPDTVAPAVTVPTATDTAVAATESEPPVQPVPAKGRSMVVPVILILIGLGVLVVLFRASSS